MLRYKGRYFSTFNSMLDIFSVLVHAHPVNLDLKLEAVPFSCNADS
jgi:hypothetical protein